MKTKRGRPSKITPELIKEFADVLSTGVYMETAAEYIGVSKISLYAWLKKGRKEKKGIHRDFLNAVKKALAKSELSALSVITKASRGYDVIKERTVIKSDGTVETSTEKTREFSWQAAAWHLERKHPKRWGRRLESKVDLKTNEPVTVNVKLKEPPFNKK